MTSPARKACAMVGDGDTHWLSRMGRSSSASWSSSNSLTLASLAIASGRDSAGLWRWSAPRMRKGSTDAPSHPQLGDESC